MIWRRTCWRIADAPVRMVDGRRDPIHWPLAHKRLGEKIVLGIPLQQALPFQKAPDALGDALNEPGELHAR